MEFETLEYAHRASLAPILRAKNSYLSEYSFTNAYLFRNPHKYQVAVSDGCTFLHGVTYDNKTYMMPVCPLEIIPTSKLIEMGSHVDFFFPIQEEWLSFFPEDKFSYTFLEGDSDYIYLTERLATMAGRKLAKKRNLLKQYNEGYKIEDYELTLDRFEDAKYILDIWEKDIQSMDNHGTDYAETFEALEKMNEFNLRGMISYADNKPSGFVLGEELNDESFALHFAKGIREYKGIYQHLYNAFAQKLISDYKYLNFEQDLGKDTLRQAKSTYYPDEMRKKYRVALKK